jgi:hypothetical protein
MHSRMARMFLAAGFFALGACADAGDAGSSDAAGADAAAGTEDAAEGIVDAGPVATDVDTTAAAVWAYMQEASYGDWELWPGTSEQYEGGEPHGMLLTTRINEVAAAALAGGATTLPRGSFVVKDNFTPDGTLAAITTMYKAGGGYNPDHNDWWFAKFLPDGAPDRTPDGMPMAGRLGGCQGCHGAQADNDYILTSPLQGAGEEGSAGGGAGR